MTIPGHEAGLTAGRADDHHAVAALADEWRELAVARGNPFITPEWFMAWQPSRGPTEPSVCWVRRGSRLIGVLPLVFTRRSISSVGPGDWFHPACAVEDEVTVATKAAHVLPEGWTEILLRNVPVDADWVDVLRASSQADLAKTRLGMGVVPRIDPPDFDHEWDAYLQGRSKSMTKHRGRRARKVQRDHSASFRRADPADLAAEMAAFFRLHFARQGSRSSLKGWESALTLFSEAASALGWLELSFLRVDGDDRASKLYFEVGDVLWAFQGGLDPGSDTLSRLSLAGVLQDHAFAAAFERGVDQIVLGVGGEEYKLRLAQHVDHVETLRLTRADRPWDRLMSRFHVRAAYLRFRAAARARLPG